MTTTLPPRDFVRLGAGSGFAGDRIEPAIELVEQGDIDFLIFECLAERTIALAQERLQADPEGGFDPMLLERMRRILPAAHGRGVRIITNAGAANPVAAARAVAQLAGQLGLSGLRIAAVTGDDVLAIVADSDLPLIDRGGSVADLRDRMVSANAYLGAEGIVEALDAAADVVITGRVGDPALFLAPLIHTYRWASDDWARLGRGTLVGHLLECAGQLTGGYFADPGRKDVPGLARLGFPFADVDVHGDAIVGKVAGSGGLLSVATCTEQLLYEVLDPAAYLQADVTADFSQVALEQVGPDRVAVRGGGGCARPGSLKVSIGYDDGFIGEGQISYAGPGAVARAQLALRIVRERLDLTGVALEEVRTDIIGGDAAEAGADHPFAELRARIVGRSRSIEGAHAIGAEVEALYTNGPFGGGGVSRSTRRVVAIASCLVSRDAITPTVQLIEAHDAVA
ncbi:acyclic terpene utilization AtuA family protein [uncultured Sphingomonas sp.]|uniref:acyclic terpene utilization AtuA family protein n=1 Tax=uncultured Sphingomonas sp. TaxID=158754 RepID=UPI0025E6981E|nr:acyclic terpene utilization AtuA family protein [uncultured Sphingomonas sp.]